MPQLHHRVAPAFVQPEGQKVRWQTERWRGNNRGCVPGRRRQQQESRHYNSRWAGIPRGWWAFSGSAQSPGTLNQAEAQQRATLSFFIPTAFYGRPLTQKYADATIPPTSVNNFYRILKLNVSSWNDLLWALSCGTFQTPPSLHWFPVPSPV